MMNGHGPAEKKLENGAPLHEGPGLSGRHMYFVTSCGFLPVVLGRNLPVLSSSLACGEAENLRIEKTLQPSQACFFFFFFF